MDFLSALVYYQQSIPINTTIVLNSLSNLRRINNLLPNFTQINLFLDNDNAGENATNDIISQFPNAVNHSRIIYPEYKDFNDFLKTK
jgi:DNA primase